MSAFGDAPTRAFLCPRLAPTPDHSYVLAVFAGRRRASEGFTVMLQQVRSGLKGAVAWFVIVLLILAFALWGVPSLQEFTRSDAVKVGDQGFSAQYVQNEFNRAVQIRRLESDGAFTREDALASGFQNDVIASITATAALDQYADRIGLATPREAVRDYLQSSDNFKNPATGEFDRMTLLRILQNYNMSVSEFEGRIADELQRQRFVDSLVTQAPAPRALADLLLLRERERRRINTLLVTEEMAGKPAEPTPDDLQTYYENNPSAFTAPEYRTFDMLVLRNEDFRDADGVAEEELQRVYELNRERLYEKPERRTLYQVTFDTEAQAQAAAAALRQGTPFEEIAAGKGFDLDDVTFADAEKRDILDPAVADAAFAADLEESAIIDPVRSLFGWTVAQVAAITPPETTPFEEAREEIENQLLDQGTRRALLDAVDEIEIARDTGASLAAAAEEAGFEVETVGPVDRFSFAPGGAIVDGVPGAPLAEAFLLEEDQQSEALELGDGEGYFFVALQNVREPALIAFEDVRDEVVARWRKEEKDRRIATAVREIRTAIEDGASLAEAAAQFDREPEALVIDQTFEGSTIAGPLVEQVFAAAPGDLVSGPAADGSGQVVAIVDEVGFASQGPASQQQDVFRRYLGYQMDQELAEAFLAAVRDEYSVTIDNAQLENVFGDAL